MRIKWTIISRLIGAVGVLCCGVGFASASAGCGGLATDSVCPAGAKPVSESPIGAIDGRNTTFTLRATPIAGLPVRVFDNGIEVDDHEYQVSAQTLTFSASHAPIPGDVIDVFLFTQGSTDSTQSQPQAPVSAGQQEILTQLLQQAMNREIIRAQEESRPNTATIPQGVDRSTRIARNAEQFRSLDMLARRLRTTDGADANNNDHRSVSLDGVEGLGDFGASSPFDEMTNSENSELGELLQKPGIDARSASGGASHGFSSIRMLSQRINTHSENGGS